MKKLAIEVKDLQKFLQNGNDVLIVDLRTGKQREEWKVEGSVGREVYFALLTADKSLLNNIGFSSSTRVVVVCHEGSMSLIAADILLERGYKAHSLKGGMGAWSQGWVHAEIKNNNLTIIQIRTIVSGRLSYIIGSCEDAIVIDACLAPEVYLNVVRQKKWKIRYVVDTHIQAGRISHAPYIAHLTGAKHLAAANARVYHPFTPLMDGQSVEFGQSVLYALHTPGDTSGGICGLIDNKYLLTGDNLSVDDLGRPDFGVRKSLAMDSEKRLFASLDKIKVICGDPIILSSHTSQAVSFKKKLDTIKLSKLLEQAQLLGYRYPILP